ncbi:sulfurtransferase complex subunit TusD [Marinobacterium sp. D7]|uniref:sulfurtransferase complex subunit TusD n=1 Tax=Marinobacterium ramblicola TaxID=2849041 RepID=UPI001C2DA2D1|nr:sulfurtransferase complex subunit TusD [Marinobacterium ramblicola]MBV1789912.1 sulfurtransferase complex subunit TusD [Marinobacterium ramblicola]
MIFSIVVQAPPVQTQGAETALRFARAVLAAGHSIHRIFFYRDGVHNGSALTCTPQDEFNIPQQWQELAQQHKLDLVVCIAAAVRRGVINEQEAVRYKQDQWNLRDSFELSGLGQLVEACIQSDRVVTFGARS